MEKTQDLLKREAKAADFVRCETQKEWFFSKNTAGGKSVVAVFASRKEKSNIKAVVCGVGFVLKYEVTILGEFEQTRNFLWIVPDACVAKSCEIRRDDER